MRTFVRLEHEECREDSGRQDAERELARVLHVPIDHETADGPALTTRNVTSGRRRTDPIFVDASARVRE